MNIEKIEYEDRIVAFIDILGFRSFINETFKDETVNQEKVDELVNVLSLIKDEFKKVSENGEFPYSFMITYFSDSIVISLKQHNNLGLLAVFEVLKRIQIKLIKHEILLRGGIVVGKIIHREDLILGPAMNDAYDLESKSALYPRITIDPDVMEMTAKENNLSDNIYTIKDFNHQKIFELDFDNTYYVDYFSDVKDFLEDGNEIEYYKTLRRLIRKGVKRKDIGLRMKYMWMLKKFNLGKPSYVKDMAYKEVDELNVQVKNIFN